MLRQPRSLPAVAFLCAALASPGLANAALIDRGGAGAQRTSPSRRSLAAMASVTASTTSSGDFLS